MEEFTIEFEAQREWGWLAILDFFFAGTGAGLFVIGELLAVQAAQIIGLAGVAAGALALLADLGRPLRFWRAIARPATSWISRGAILVTLFFVFGILDLVLPTSTGIWGSLMGVFSMLAALGVMSYTGFLLAHARGIPAWHSALMPVQFIAISLLSGCGVLYLLPTLNVRTLVFIGLVLGIATLLVLVANLLSLGAGSLAERRAVYELTRKTLAPIFVLAGLIVGILIPTGIIAYVQIANAYVSEIYPLIALAGVLFLVGGFSVRYSLVRAGFYQPIVEMSRSRAAVEFR